MQILYNCEIQRKTKSFENEHHQDVSNLLSKSSNVHENELRFKVKQKMRKQRSALSSELIQLSPMSQKDGSNECENDKYSLNKINRQMHQADSNIKSINEKYKAWGKGGTYQHQYALNVPIQMISQDEMQEDAGLNDTGQIMNNKFDRILEMSYADQKMNILQIQSKFTVIRSYGHLKEPQCIEPDTNPQQAYNAHQRLLEEQNHYLREQFMEFTQNVEKSKHQFQQVKQKYRRCKKQNQKLTAQIKQLTTVYKILQKQLAQKDIVISNLSLKLEESERCLSGMVKQKHRSDHRIQRLEKSCLQFQQKLQSYDIKKQYQIQIMEEEKIKLKQFYQEQLLQKDKELNALNDYINQLKSKQQQLLLESSNKNQDNVLESSKMSDDQSSSKIFQNGVNSICLSLAEAESLKNIIEEKEQLHKNQVFVLKSNFLDKETQMQKNIFNLQEKIIQLEKMNSKLISENEVNKQTIERLENMILNLSDCPEGPENLQEWNGGGRQQLLKLGYSRRIKKLQKHIEEAREEKMELMSKINQLQKKCLTGEKQEDEQLQQLLENCVNELQKQRQLNYMLRNENQYYKQLVCKQQMLAKTMTSCIYN